MDRSNSISSSSSTSSGGTDYDHFRPYQARFLERASSLRSNGSLSRSNSQTGNSAAARQNTSGTSKFVPTHRIGNSLDAVRGKWEERVRAEMLSEQVPTSPRVRSPTSPLHSPRDIMPSPSSEPLSTASPLRPSNAEDDRRNKRYTMPAPLITSPLSPNSTGISIDSPSTHGPTKIHVPSPLSPQSAPTSSPRGLGFPNPVGKPTSSPPSRYRRSNTVGNTAFTSAGSFRPSDTVATSPESSASYSRPALTPATPLGKRPSSMYGNPHVNPPSPRAESHASSNTSAPMSASVSPEELLGRPHTPESSPSSMAPPTPYKSTYMNKKYGQLSEGRRLGNHLPRIASGEETKEDNTWEDNKAKDRQIRIEKRAKYKLEQMNVQSSSQPLRAMEYGAVVVPHGNDVAGVPGRVPFHRDKAPLSPTSPLPTHRLRGGLWADTQRHLLVAYEYLCHVGEAQQWIEGVLGEELGFGVVELEDGLRNGVVLAKLVRKIQGHGAVKRIYEAPKLDFRHSDNIHYFLTFVRQVGLPECFIFELTDLYDKKNMPKVIYCIHALSHLLARRGLAQRVGNLLGHLKFSDDQLQKTQKGLKESGVPIPNFGNVGRELAKEINEPEVEVETEDERRDRLLLENEGSIIAIQSVARGFLVRTAQATNRVRIRLAERHVARLQAVCRGALVRRMLETQRRQRSDFVPWVVALQAASRCLLVRQRWCHRLRQLRASSRCIVKLQAQARGVIQRRRLARLKAALRNSNMSIVKLQALSRARIARASHKELKKTFSHRLISPKIVSMQAQARGAYARAAFAKRKKELAHKLSPLAVALQAHCRGAIMRRRMKTQMARIEDVTDVVVRIQTAARTFLARKRLLSLIRALRKVTPVITRFQAQARGNLARKQCKGLVKALSTAQVAVSVGGLQAVARAALARNRRCEQRKCLEFFMPDVVGFQAVCRGALIRQDFMAWREHLWNNQGAATTLQALLRGALQRKKFYTKLQYYQVNLDKVVKIQSLFRAKETREQYRQLTLGTNVTVGTIKNFVHLLDDSEADFQDEIRVERLRKKAVESIREIQALENEVSELDVKIALVVQNVKSAKELLKSRRRHRADSVAVLANKASVLAAHGDPFAGPNTLDHAAKRKLELYQQLFYLLQTRTEYLCRLFTFMSADNVAEKNRRLTERVVLTLFGYGQDRREHYLLLKLLQHCIHDEISSADSIEAIVRSHPMYLNIAVQYIRPKQLIYVREALQRVICEVVASDDLDLETDPSAIHLHLVEYEEMRTGMTSSTPKDVAFYQALEEFPGTRAEYIRHLQLLQGYTEAFINAIMESTRKMPYGMRFLVRETLAALRTAFPNAPLEAHAACVGRLLFNRYINPAIITPETFNIVAKTVDVKGRKNLSQIARVITQIISGMQFGEDNPAYLPINLYVGKAIRQMTAWCLEVGNVPDAESQFHAHEFLDVTEQPKPIYISPNEVYAMHTLLAQHLNELSPNRDDTLRVILSELNGVPNLGTEELKDARDKAVTLELTNRFAHVKDPQADEKALWVQAKRGVLAILRVQPAEDLVESLMRPVTDEEESRWDDILENEMEMEQMQPNNRRMPSMGGADGGYRLEDIRSLTFKEVKAHTIFFLLELEKKEKISRNDGFQGVLNAIAGDVRSKHRKRIQRQQEMESVQSVLKELAVRKKYFEEQINSYHDYVDAAMNTMQRGNAKKRFVLPFTKQYFHLRDLQKSGKNPQFGSFKYGAKEWYEKGILLSVDQYSPRQFDKVNLIISSNEAGIFTLEIHVTTMGHSDCVGSTQIRMEDLLQAQFEDRASLSLFNGTVKLNLNSFLYQINKKFYA